MLADDDRAARLLALTGLDPQSLRDGLGSKATLAAVLEHLAGHEPDLLAAADALGLVPDAIPTALAELVK